MSCKVYKEKPQTRHLSGLKQLLGDGNSALHQGSAIRIQSHWRRILAVRRVGLVRLIYREARKLHCERTSFQSRAASRIDLRRDESRPDLLESKAWRGILAEFRSDVWCATKRCVKLHRAAIAMREQAFVSRYKWRLQQRLHAKRSAQMWQDLKIAVDTDDCVESHDERILKRLASRGLRIEDSAGAPDSQVQIDSARAYACDQAVRRIQLVWLERLCLWYQKNASKNDIITRFHELRGHVKHLRIIESREKASCADNAANRRQKGMKSGGVVAARMQIVRRPEAVTNEIAGTSSTLAVVPVDRTQYLPEVPEKQQVDASPRIRALVVECVDAAFAAATMQIVRRLEGKLQQPDNENSAIDNVANEIAGTSSTLVDGTLNLPEVPEKEQVEASPRIRTLIVGKSQQTDENSAIDNVANEIAGTSSTLYVVPVDGALNLPEVLEKQQVDASPRIRTLVVERVDDTRVRKAEKIEAQIKSSALRSTSPGKPQGRPQSAPSSRNNTRHDKMQALTLRWNLKSGGQARSMESASEAESAFAPSCNFPTSAQSKKMSKRSQRPGSAPLHRGSQSASPLAKMQNAQSLGSAAERFNPGAIRGRMPNLQPVRQRTNMQRPRSAGCVRDLQFSFGSVKPQRPQSANSTLQARSNTIIPRPKSACSEKSFRSFLGYDSNRRVPVLQNAQVQVTCVALRCNHFSTTICNGYNGEETFSQPEFQGADLETFFVLHDKQVFGQDLVPRPKDRHKAAAEGYYQDISPCWPNNGLLQLKDRPRSHLSLINQRGALLRTRRRLLGTDG